jgi:hypothetical protein
MTTMHNSNRKSAFLSGIRQCSNQSITAVATLACLVLAPGFARAEAMTPRLDLAIAFVGDRTNPVGGANSWLTGGGIELGVNAWHGFGIAADVAALHTSSTGSQGVPLSLVTTAFGPRYRYTRGLASGRQTISAFGEALLGEANAGRSLFPSAQGVTGSANSLALQVGGGLDVGLSRRLAVRAIQASWLRTQLPNNSTNVQNHFQLGSGLVIRF